jgi:hypothetical protein
MDLTSAAIDPEGWTPSAQAEEDLVRSIPPIRFSCMLRPTVDLHVVSFLRVLPPAYLWSAELHARSQSLEQQDLLRTSSKGTSRDIRRLQ